MNEEKVLVTVAGEAITEQDFEAYLEKLPQQQKAYASSPYFRQQILGQIVNTRLMAKYGEDQKLEETDEFKKTMADLRKDILAQLAINQIISAVSVSDEEAQTYFSENQDKFAKAETVSAKHILVETEEQCKEIAVQIAAASITFEDAAKQYSTCPSKERGGDLGTFGHGQMVAEFDSAAFAADLNTVVGPVKTQFGYHLIQVYDKTEAQIPIYEEISESVKNTLLNNKKQTALEKKLDELRAMYL